MRGVLKEKDLRANSATASIIEAQQVLSNSIGKTTGAYEKLNMEKGGMSQMAGSVATESSETIDFILGNFEEASTELGSAKEALENIAEDISTLNELDADAKVETDSFGDFVRETLNVLTSIEAQINEQGKVVSEVADRTQKDANRAESLAQKVEAAQEIKYGNRKLAKEAKEQALIDASDAVAAYRDAVMASDNIKEAFNRAVELKNDAEEKVNDARCAFNIAQSKADLAHEELNIIMTENGLDPYADGLDGEVKKAVETAQCALEKANEAASIAAIDLIGRQYELAEAEGKLAVARTKQEDAQEEAIDSLRNVLDKTVEAIKTTNESAESAKAAVNDAYVAVMQSAEELKRLSLQANADKKSMDLAQSKRDEARKVYVEALENMETAQENVERAQEAAKKASKIAGLNFDTNGKTKKAGKLNSIWSLFGSKKKEKKIYSHNNA